MTAFVSLRKPLLALPHNDNDRFESFEVPELNVFLADYQNSHNYRSWVWHPALSQMLPDDLIAALRGLDTMTAFLHTSPTLSKYDILVYDRKRARLQHQLASVAILSCECDAYGTVGSCRIAAILYSIFALWGFTPPLKIIGDLAQMLQRALQTSKDGNWAIWSDILLWTLFIGGYAAFQRQERLWFLTVIQYTLQSRNLTTWYAVREALDTMPVHHSLWDPFEVLWREAKTVVLEKGNI